MIICWSWEYIGQTQMGCLNPLLPAAHLLVEPQRLGLRFIRNVLLWGDPETAKGDMAPELLELQKQAQAR